MSSRHQHSARNSSQIQIPIRFQIPFQLTRKLQSSTLDSHSKVHTLFAVPCQFVRSVFVLRTARLYKSAQNVALVKPAKIKTRALVPTNPYLTAVSRAMLAEVTRHVVSAMKVRATL